MLRWPCPAGEPGRRPDRPAHIRDWNTGNKFDGYEVIAGFHRFAAVKKLKWDMVDCHVVEVEELEATLLTCDENLARFDLSKAERAVITHRRKEAYEAIHPTAKQGGDRRSSRKVCDLVDPSFVADTVEKTGKSEGIVQLDAERGTKIDPTVLREISGTELDKGVVLDRLAKIPMKEQMPAVQKMRTEEAGSNAKPAARPDQLKELFEWLLFAKLIGPDELFLKVEACKMPRVTAALVSVMAGREQPHEQKLSEKQEKLLQELFRVWGTANSDTREWFKKWTRQPEQTGTATASFSQLALTYRRAAH